MIFLGNDSTIDYSDQTKTQITRMPLVGLKNDMPEEMGDFIREKLIPKKVAKKDLSQLFTNKL